MQYSFWYEMTHQILFFFISQILIFFIKRSSYYEKYYFYFSIELFSEKSLITSHYGNTLFDLLNYNAIMLGRFFLPFLKALSKKFFFYIEPCWMSERKIKVKDFYFQRSFSRFLTELSLSNFYQNFHYQSFWLNFHFQTFLLKFHF